MKLRMASKPQQGRRIARHCLMKMAPTLSGATVLRSCAPTKGFAIEQPLLTSQRLSASATIAKSLIDRFWANDGHPEIELSSSSMVPVMLSQSHKPSSYPRPCHTIGFPRLPPPVKPRR